MDIYHEEMKEYRQKYPEEVKSRKKAMSNAMRRNVQGRFHKNDRKEEEEEKMSESSESLSSSRSIQTAKNKKKEVSKVKNNIKQKDLLSHKPKGAVSSFFHFYQKNMDHFSKMVAQKENKDKKATGPEIVKKAS